MFFLKLVVFVYVLFGTYLTWWAIGEMGRDDPEYLRRNWWRVYVESCYAVLFWLPEIIAASRGDDR